MSNKLEKELFASVEKNTPEEIRKNPLFNLDNVGEFEFILTRELVEELKLRKWFENYKKEAMASTGGIRGAQNILYPWDARFPLNQLGVVLATLGKAHVAKDKKLERIQKIASCEVRYNSKPYVEVIARVQAAEGINTYVPKEYGTTSIWMTSFLIFMLDLYGGEYVTSSHAISTKIATKDLNDEGSQYMPEESLEFVSKIDKILKTAETKGSYRIRFSAKHDNHIDFDFFDRIDYGAGLYIDYLKNSIATPTNVQLIKSLKNKVIIECVGGCMYDILVKLFDKLSVSDRFEFLNKEEDPFFHGVGKVDFNPKTNKPGYFDYSCDTTIPAVAKTLGYEKKLKNKNTGTTILLTDPDGDRLVVYQIESSDAVGRLKKLGVDYLKLDDKKIVSMFTPNQSFLITMDFYMKQLKREKTWNTHPRFMIKTTPSAHAWNEWAGANSIAVLDVPVGFKEIAAMMRKVESQIKKGKDVAVKDVYGNKINLGKEPRIVFAGEESGGMILGPNELIKSRKGRIALAMREKSAGEAILVLSALAGEMERQGITMSEQLEKIFEENNIKWRYDLREEIIYYNENESDPEKLLKEKAEGEILRDKLDNFYLSIALARRENMITIGQAREILNEVGISSRNLLDVKFVGDGTYFLFKDKYIEIRKSGTDAKTKAYSCGENKEECRRETLKILSYSGELTKIFRKYIPEDFYKTASEKAMRIYLEFLREK